MHTTINKLHTPVNKVDVMIKKTSLLLAFSRWPFALHGKEARNREPKQGKRKVTSEER